MKKKIFLIFIYFFFLNGYKAQNFSWAKSGKGTYFDAGVAVDLCSNGDIVIAGRFESPSLVFDTYTLTNVFQDDGFLVKYNSLGQIQWAKSYGNGSIEITTAACVDKNDNIYVTRFYNNPMLTKYDLNGNVLWTKSALGGATALSVCSDQNGDIIVAGSFSTPTICLGTYTLINKGNNDFFVVKFDANGNVIWARSEGDSGNEAIRSVTVDFMGNFFITGLFSSPTFSIGGQVLANYGYFDGFIAKLDPNGNVLWVRNIGGTGNDGSNSITVDPSGNAYITGNTSSDLVHFDTLILSPNVTGGANVPFIAKYDRAGYLRWVRVPKTGSGIGYDISAYQNGVYVTGSFTSPTIVFDTDTLSYPTGAPNPAFISEYDLNGNLLCTKAISSSGDGGLKADAYGNVYICSSFAFTLTLGSNSLVTGWPGVTNVFTTQFNCSHNVAVKELGSINGINIFPSPSSGEINVTNLQGDEIIRIYNTLGKDIYRSELKGIASHNISLASHSKGIYFVEVKRERSHIVTWKIILQ